MRRIVNRGPARFRISFNRTAAGSIEATLRKNRTLSAQFSCCNMFRFSAQALFMATALTLFDRFGGVRPMASVLEERPSTVQGWKDNGRIPSTKQPLVLRRGEQLGLEISAEDVVFPLGRDVEADPSARIPTRLEALQWAIDEAGSEEALARMCGANVTDVWKWVQIRQAPREYVIAIECGTGVPREYLRPDIFPIKDASKLKPWKPKPARRGRRPAAVVNG